jgi:hypothetical protein
MLTGEYPARSQIGRNTQSLFNVFNFTNLLRRPGLGRPTATAKEGTGAEETIRLLVVTLDDALYFSLRTAAVHCGWELWKASSVDQGMGLLDESRATLVIFDWNPEEGDWEPAMDRFAARADHPCILLASKVIDNYLLAELAWHGGFDAIPRSSTEEQLIRSIQFAHFAHKHSNPFSASGPSRVISGGRSFLR